MIHGMVEDVLDGAMKIRFSAIFLLVKFSTFGLWMMSF
jgi:hypothetical protein